VPRHPDSKPLPEKRRAELLKQIGVEEFPEQLLRGIDDLLRTGLRTIKADDEDSPLHCSSEYHFARMSGEGSTLVPLLYAVSFHLAGESKSFRLSMQKLRSYLNVKKDDYIYAAAYLLVASGFWEKIEAERGKPVMYRPVGHSEWAQKHPGFCTSMIKLPYSDGDELGRVLHGILGEKYFDNVLQGLRNTGATDEQIKEAARKFIVEDRNRGSGKERRKRFQKYLEEQCE
jgi:hypothetical protein